MCWDTEGSFNRYGVSQCLMPNNYATDIVFPIIATKYLIRRILVQLVRSLSNEEQQSHRRGMVKVVQPYYRSLERGFELYFLVLRPSSLL